MHVKVAFYTFKMDSSKTVNENLDEFLKMKMLLCDTSHALDDTSVVMILMNYMLDKYVVVRNSFQYAGNASSYEFVISATRTRE